MTEELKKSIIAYMKAARNFTLEDIYGLSGIPKDEVRSWIEAQCPEFLPKLAGAVKKETKDMPHNPHAFGYRKPVEVQEEAAPGREIEEKKEMKRKPQKAYDVDAVKEYIDSMEFFTTKDMENKFGMNPDNVKLWVFKNYPQGLSKLKDGRVFNKRPEAVTSERKAVMIEKKEETKDRLQEILEHYGVSYLELADAVAYYKHRRPLTLSDINDLEAFVMDLLRNNTLIDMEGVARALKISKIRLIELVKSSDNLKRAFNEHLNVKYGMSMDWFV